VPWHGWHPPVTSMAQLIPLPRVPRAIRMPGPHSSTGGEAQRSSAGGLGGAKWRRGGWMLHGTSESRRGEKSQGARSQTGTHSGSARASRVPEDGKKELSSEGKERRGHRADRASGRIRCAGSRRMPPGKPGPTTLRDGTAGMCPGRRRPSHYGRLHTASRAPSRRDH
jgi:hypothetical protein